MLAHNLWKSVSLPCPYNIVGHQKTLYIVWKISWPSTNTLQCNSNLEGKENLAYLTSGSYLLPHSPGVIRYCAKNKNWVYSLPTQMKRHNIKSNNHKKEYELHHREQKGISDRSHFMSHVPYSTSVSRSKRDNKSAITMEPFAPVHSTLKA